MNVIPEIIGAVAEEIIDNKKEEAVNFAPNEQKAFYDGLAMGNAVSYQQAQNNIMLSVTTKLTQAIMEGEDSERVSDLMALMKDLHNQQ